MKLTARTRVRAQQRLPNGRAAAEQHVEHARRQARRRRRLGEQRGQCDDISAGLSTTVLPNASAGAAFQSGIASGKFHGVMSATTPSGSRSVNCSAPGGLRRNDLADLAHRFAGVVAQDRDAARDLAARLADRLADLAA